MSRTLKRDQQWLWTCNIRKLSNSDLWLFIQEKHPIWPRGLLFRLFTLFVLSAENNWYRGYYCSPQTVRITVLELTISKHYNMELSSRRTVLQTVRPLVLMNVVKCYPVMCFHFFRTISPCKLPARFTPLLLLLLFSFSPRSLDFQWSWFGYFMRQRGFSQVKMKKSLW